MKHTAKIELSNNDELTLARAGFYEFQGRAANYRRGCTR